MVGILLFVLFSLNAKDIGIVSVYGGKMKYDMVYNNSLDDDGKLYGVYLQYIDPDRFQANAFLYKADDMSFSDVKGLHFNLDYYIKHTDKGKVVAGLSYEDILG